MTQGPTAVSFDTTLSTHGNSTGIEVPDEVIERLGHGRRPPVLVDLGGHSYRSTVAVMGGRHLLSVSAAVGAATGLRGGDPVRVTLRVAHSPQEVDVPDDLAESLAAAGVRPFFDSLSNSLQRYHVDSVEAARSPQTRQRRIDKAVTLFLEGKKR